MDTTRSFNNTDATADYERTTLAAIFADRDQAHDVIHRLHDEGFRDTWLGITKSDSADGYGTSTDETRVEADNWFTRFFGEGDESLHDALARHGVAEADTRSAGTLPANSAIITVDGANHPELAAQIITESGGRLITKGFGSMGYGTPGSYGSTSMSTPASSAAIPSTGTYASGRAAVGSSTDLGTDVPYDVAAEPAISPAGSFATVGNATDDRYATDMPAGALDAGAAQNYGSYRGGTTIDDNQRIQLREERLRIDKERRSLGEATIGKEIVTQTQEVDVPLIREELFIERRPVTGEAVASTGAIGSDTEVIRIPLTEEKVNVSKVAVVTEEVVVGKRQVEEVGHVSETTRKEQLNVQDVNQSMRTGTRDASDPLI